MRAIVGLAVAILLFFPARVSAETSATLAEKRKEVDVLAEEASTLRRDIRTIIDQQGMSQANSDALRLWARINNACTTQDRPSLDRCPQALSDIQIAYNTVSSEIAALQPPSD